jgi:hypothetical protein
VLVRLHLTSYTMEARCLATYLRVWTSPYVVGALDIGGDLILKESMFSRQLQDRHDKPSTEAAPQRRNKAVNLGAPTSFTMTFRSGQQSDSRIGCTMLQKCFANPFKKGAVTRGVFTGSQILVCRLGSHQANSVHGFVATYKRSSSLATPS